MTPRVPPASLDAVFDHHGVRVEVRPRRPLGPRLRALVGFVSLVGIALAAVSLSFLVGLITGPLGFGPEALGVGLGVGLWVALLAALARFERHAERARLRVRLGEGWLVARPTVGRAEQRVDLCEVERCEIVRGPDLKLYRTDGDPFVLPMRGHELDAVGWLASAIYTASRAARYGELPAPESLLQMRRQTDERAP